MVFLTQHTHTHTHRERESREGGKYGEFHQAGEKLADGHLSVKRGKDKIERSMLLPNTHTHTHTYMGELTYWYGDGGLTRQIACRACTARFP